MITVPEATKKIIERSRYLSEAMSKGLINYSSLARYIKPELEEMLIKKVSIASIVMALNRLEVEFAPKYNQTNIFKIAPEMIVRSSLYFTALPNSDMQGLSMLLAREADPRSFYAEVKGINNTSLVVSSDLFAKYKSTIESKKTITPFVKVAALTIYVPEEALKLSGVYYFFLKSLAWEGVNVIEIVSTPGELTIIVEEETIERAFGIVKSLFASQ